MRLAPIAGFALLVLLTVAAPSRGGDGFRGRFELAGWTSGARGVRVELEVDGLAEGRLRVARHEASLFGGRTTWTSEAVRVDGDTAEVTYRVAEERGLIDLLDLFTPGRRCRSERVYVGRYRLSGDRVVEVVRRTAGEGGWSRAWTWGRRSLAPARVRVLTYNIHHGEGEDGRLDLARIAALMRAERADLVAVQEVDRRVRRSGGHDQPRELERLTGLRSVFGPNLRRFQGGDYGNVVLTRAAPGRTTNHRLPNPEQKEPRGLLDVALTLRHPDGAREEVRFLATHFGFGPAQLPSVAAVGEVVRAAPDRPMVLAGDLNAEPDSAVLDALRAQGWVVAGGPSVLPTHPAPRPRRQIDYVLYRPASRWRVVEARVTGNGVDSDHRPLIAELELLPPDDPR